MTGSIISSTGEPPAARSVGDFSGHVVRQRLILAKPTRDNGTKFVAAQETHKAITFPELGVLVTAANDECAVKPFVLQ